MNQVRTNEPISLCLKILNIPSSSYYYITTHPLETPLQKYAGLRPKVEKIIDKNPGYGYRRIRAALVKKGISLNKKVVQKLLKLWHLQHKRKIRRYKPSSLAKSLKQLGAKANLVSHLSNPQVLQVIFTDFTEITTVIGTFQLVLFSDMISRRITGWNVDLQATTKSALQGLRKVKRYLTRKKIDLNKVIVHQDQGSAFTSYEYVGELLNDGITPSFTEKGFKDNPAMESCNGHFKNEYVDLFYDTRSPQELKNIIKKCVRNWNAERIHSALNGLSPDEFIHTICKL